MTFTPSNTVRLLDVPLDITQKNQLYFDTKTEQTNYFMSKYVRDVEDIDYVRKDNKIVVDGQLDDYWNCNYVLYQNSDFNTKWFYAFITRMEWESERSFSIYIETDVFQTWLFEKEMLQSFVVREHVNDDAIGKNLVDEGLEFGEYIVNSYEQTEVLNDIWYVMAVSDTISDSDTVIRGIYGNVYSGLAFFAYAPEDYITLSAHINNYVNVGKGDAIQFIYTIPKAVLPSNIVSGNVIPNGSNVGGINYEFKTFSGTSEEVVNFKHLDGYTPLNNKLYCYPYNVLYVSNNNGGSAEYRFEYFWDFENSEKLFFWIEGNMSPNPTVVLYAGGYKVADPTKNLYNPEYALQLTGFPLCSWGNDTYNAWVAQNGVQTVISAGASGIAILGGAISANPAVIVGGAVGVASQMAQLYKAGLQPDQAKGNTNGASLNIAVYRQNFTFSRMSLKAEYAERIDNYFTMYGYKVNALKKPSLHTRKVFNYIQTVDVNIKGAIPADDMKQLKQIFNQGVTLWHDAEKYCNYSYSNDIL